MNERTGFGYLITAHGPSILREAFRQEIERAIDNVKRTVCDKWFRRQWYRATAQRNRRHSSHRQRMSGARR